jgi:hypothetical protein
LPDSLIERRLIQVGGDGLPGKRIEFVGLQATITHVLVRVEFAGGKTFTALIKPRQPWVNIQGPLSFWEAGKNYLKLGVDHILLGIDHLLFVLGLLLSKTWRLLIRTITAFTVGHSISLALATLELVYVPAKPLGAVIALSIVFLAAELVRSKRGEQSLTIRYPWIVSFGFGMLHGLGFAGALIALGLPKGSIISALLFFNLGVEAGQILFVAIALMLMASLRRMKITLPVWSRALPVYGMGSVAAYWFVGRLAMML